jgi:hypothetical protein
MGCSDAATRDVTISGAEARSASLATGGGELVRLITKVLTGPVVSCGAEEKGSLWVSTETWLPSSALIAFLSSPQN